MLGFEPTPGPSGGGELCGPLPSPDDFIRTPDPVEGSFAPGPQREDCLIDDLPATSLGAFARMQLIPGIGEKRRWPFRLAGAAGDVLAFAPFL